ncbi:MAG: dihydrolipoamide acetyltransferase family protein [Pseudomonadota bacterium]|nr:dihydrolipoamide acetyltransferase family protein [Pseudomonadota bacterium]
MAEHTFRLPDIGEGIAEAELADWLVKPGDIVQEDDPICEVTTDKATVEIPASVGGRVTWLGGKPGDVLAIGSDLIRIETDADVPAPAAEPEPAPAAEPDSKPEPQPKAEQTPKSKPKPRPAAGGKPLAAPSVRGRAIKAGVDLRRVPGSGPAGRILHEDLDDFLERGPATAPGPGLARRTATEVIPVTGVRRAISEKMAEAKRHIPHFSIIEEVDVEALEDLRAGLNARFADTRGKLTLLPFLLRALAQAVKDHPQINAHFDDAAGVVTRHAALHAGIATQTDQGLMVPVVRHAEAMTPWESATEIRRLSDAARARRAAPKDLTGSTLTITSLGTLGAVATTPIINRPEVAIVGVNKIAVRPVWTGAAFAPRRMMNLSCSFDHRVVDGHVAALFVADVKALLETPAMLFMELGND